MYILPSVTDTVFTVSLPRGLRPAVVCAGYDAEPADPYQSFLLSLRLDWRADAPRIIHAQLAPINAPARAVSPTRIRLAAGPPLHDPDVLDEDNNVLICDVRFAPESE